MCTVCHMTVDVHVYCVSWDRRSKGVLCLCRVRVVTNVVCFVMFVLKHMCSSYYLPVELSV